jgi:predicted MFS family arabinose efflux permease
MGMIGAAFGLGFIFGPPIGGFLKENYGIAYIGYFTAALCVLNFILAFFLLPESLKEKTTQRRTAKDSFMDIWHVSQRPILKDIFLINFIYIGAYSAIQIICALLWKDIYLLTDKQIGYVFAFIGVWAAIVQGGLIGIIARKMGERTMLINGFFVLATGIVFLPFVPLKLFVPLELLALMFTGFSNGMLMPAINATTSRLSAAHEQGKVLGVMQSIGSLARGIGPIVGGLLYGFNYHTAFIFSALCMILGAYLSKRFADKNMP